MTYQGKEIEGYLDTSWGEYVYFQIDYQWVKFKHGDLQSEQWNSNEFNLDNPRWN